MSTTCSACEAAPTTCTMCHAAVCTEHTQMGQPFITARQLVATTASTALRTPRMLGDILFSELSTVPYCPNCRQEIAGKRQTEQMKFLLGILLLILLAISVPLYLVLAV